MIELITGKFQDEAVLELIREYLLDTRVSVLLQEVVEEPDSEPDWAYVAPRKEQATYRCIAVCFYLCGCESECDWGD